MSSGEQVPKKQARRELHKDMYEAIKPLMNKGWTLVRSGHKFQLWCPCEVPQGIRVDGTPKNPTWKAKKITAEASKCPRRHSLMSSKLRR